MNTQHALRRAEYERELDVAIAGSFPASDPPPWTLGASPWMDLPGTAARIPMPVPAATDVIVEDGRRWGGIRLTGLGEAIAMTAMVPLALLLAGVPLVALVWGIATAISWLIGNS